MNLIDRNDSISYSGTANNVITTGVSTGIQYYRVCSPLTLSSISEYRKVTANFPHPCLSFFLKCFDHDNNVKAYYDGDHIICEVENIQFDHKEFLKKNDNYLPLNKERLIHIISSFNQLTFDEIGILIRYLKQ